MVNGLEAITKENEELIAIIAKSIDTARRNKNGDRSDLNIEH